MLYKLQASQNELQIPEIIQLNCYEHRKPFFLPEKAYNFWRLYYLKKGEGRFLSSSKEYWLKKGEIFLCAPQTACSFSTADENSVKMIQIGFECSAASLFYFTDSCTPISEQEYSLLAMVVKESGKSRQSRKNDDSSDTFGAEQLMKLYLQLFFILLIRRHPQSQKIRLSSSAEEVYSRVLYYLEQHIRESVKIDTICRENFIGRSQLQKLFQERQHCSIMKYFTRLKINLAKGMIRENHMNFTQIADYLGYSSVQYFSRQFKKVSGMTPTQYQSSLLNNPREILN